MEIKSGPYKGFYKFNIRFLGEHGIVYGKDQPFFRVKLPFKIRGFNKTSFPYVGGYYFIPYNYDMNQIDLRRLLYVLQNKLMPMSGNTEVFEQRFNQIPVDSGYCPKLEPCPYNWCKCQQGVPLEFKFNLDVPWYYGLYKWAILGLMVMFLLIWVLLAF